MKFLKGHKYLCISDWIIDRQLAFKKGVVYIPSEDDILITKHGEECDLSSNINSINHFKEITKKEDRVNHPSHYTWLKKLCNIEVIDVTRHLNFNIGNAIKYLLRRDKEDIISLQDKRIEDLKKAVWYINDEIKRLESLSKV